MPSIYRFHFVPLTPIHIGSGQRYAPEDYAVEANVLVRLDFGAVLQAMPAAGRSNLERLLDRGQLREAQRLVSDAWSAAPPGKRRELEMFRAQLGESSARQLRQIMAQPGRAGEIHALPRNPYNGDVTIPGSSIKGAIRTAVLNGFLHDHPDSAQIRAEVERQMQASQRQDGGRMEEAVLGASRQRTERDPFRLLRVADTSWPASAVRIDQAVLTKLGRDAGAAAGMQIHVERLLSRADGEAEPEVELSLEPPPDPLDPRLSGLFRRMFDIDFIRQSCQRFYAGRIHAEANQFPWLQHSGGLWYPTAEELGNSILLRVGRYSHFDSLSVDDYRRGWNIQRRQPINGMGATRTVCEVAGGQQVPFGWALLRRVT